jgi:opacity protein-like surface antigen
MPKLTLIFCAAISLASAPAQSLFSFSAGGGPTVPAKHSGRRFDTGYNLTAGFGFHPVRRAGVIAEFGFNHLGLTNGTLRNVGVPGGSGRIYSLTLNPIIHLTPSASRFGVYLIGGGGYYRRTIEFTQPSSAIATAFDPFFGIFFPVEIPTTTVLGSYSQNRTGINGGAGLSFRLNDSSRAVLFAESRYHRIYTSPVRTSLLPVTMGFRW